MRNSSNEYHNGRLWNGYDYKNQAWVKNGRYVACGHPREDGFMTCNCYGTKFEGQKTEIDE